MINRPPPPPQPPPIPRLDQYRPSAERIEPGLGASGQRAGGYPPPSPGGQGRMPPPGPSMRGAPPSGRRGGGPLMWVAYTVLGLAALVAVGVGIVLFALPTDVIRDQIVAQVKAKTGRDLIIAGPTSFTVYPSVGLRLKDVSLSAPAGMEAKPFVTMSSLDASVRLLPLLNKEIELERLVLREPVFELAVDGEGRKSWAFAAADGGHAHRIRLAQVEAPATEPAAQPTTVTDAPPASPAAPPAPAGPANAALEQLSLADVRIENGTLRYADARSGARHEVSAINLRLALPSIREPLDAAGDLVWKGEKVDFTGTLTAVKDVLDRAPARLVVKAASAPLIAKFDGQVAVRETVDAEGVVTASSASVRAMAKWLGADVPAASGYGPLEAAGQLKVLQSGTVLLSGLDVSLDGARITGDAGAVTQGERPLIKANLKLTELDLNKYLGGGAGPAVVPKAAAPGPAEKGAGAPAQSIEDLLEAPQAPNATPGPKVQGFVQRAGLSNEPIDTAGLGAVDADVTIETDRVIYQKIRLDRTKATLGIVNKVAKLTLHELMAYEGRTTGFITADATNAKTLALGINLQAANFALAPLVKAAAGMETLSGTARLSTNIAMAGQGASQLEIAETLSGTAEAGVANGTLKYTSGTTVHSIASVDMKVGATSLTGPLTTKGSLTWNGEPIAVNGTLATLKELADARPVKINATVAGKPVTASYDGTLAMGSGLSANGSISAKTASVRALAKWLGSELPPARGFGPLELVGQLAVAANAYTLSNAKLAIDGETAAGTVSVSTAGARPQITTTLKISALDLNKYMNPAGSPPPRAASPAASGAAKPAKPAVAAPAAAPKPTKPAAAKPVSATGSTSPAPAAKPAPFPPPSKLGGPAFAQGAPGGWSEEPFNLAALGAVDLEAKLALGRLIYQNFTVGQSKLAVALKNKVLKTDFEEVQLYQGRGKGQISIDGTKEQVAAVAANLAFEGVEVLPLLKDAADLDMLAGKGNVAVNVTSKGRSQKAVVDGLDGKADMKIIDGAIVGINIPGMFRSVTTGNFAGFKSAPTEKTDFSDLSSTWAIANGVASNKDLVLSSPLLRVTGEGKVLLGARRIDYLMRPKVVANMAGQGGDQKLAGIEIPLKITGSFERPKFTPDFKDVLKNPGQFLEQFKEVGKQFKGKDAADIVKGILGGGQSGGQSGGAAQQNAQPPAGGTAAPQPAEPKKPTTKQLLDQFLKQQ